MTPPPHRSPSPGYSGVWKKLATALTFAGLVTLGAVLVFCFARSVSSLPEWTFIALLLWIGGTFGMFYIDENLRKRHAKAHAWMVCPKCFYPLAETIQKSLDEITCPECGGRWSRELLVERTDAWIAREDRH